jgi:hypothetical protein
MARTTDGQHASQPYSLDDEYGEVRRRLAAGEFPGIGRPESNYFKAPNDLFNIFNRIVDDEGDEAEDIPPGTQSACMIYQYILRHTWGFREYGIKKRITTDEFLSGRKLHDGTRMDRGAGVRSKSTVLKALKFLERRGYLDVEYDNHDLGRRAKLYKLRMAPGIADEYEG